MSKKFIIWTDASSKEIVNYDIVTVVGFVLKDDKYPCLHGSSIHYKINNSKGEIKAGIESLSILTEYCDCFGYDVEECEVEMKTDFPDLKNIINHKMVSSKNTEKLELLKELKAIRERFKSVKCDEIDRTTNIAHNVCHWGMEAFRENGNHTNGPVENFYEIYENPKLCKEKESTQN